MNKLRIPTLLGILLIIIGIGSGVYLSLKSQTITSRAVSDEGISNIIISNIEDRSTSISWQTEVEAFGFIKFVGSSDQTFKDDRDENAPVPRRLYHVTLKKLTPQTTYQFQIISGKSLSTIQNFTTASSQTQLNNTQPVIGSVLDDDNFLTEGIVYLKVPGAAIQSSVIKNFGNFLIPMSLARTQDLSSIFDTTDIEAHIEAIGENGRQGEAIFNLSASGNSLEPLRLGKSLDLTNNLATTSAKFKFDLNQDGLVNAADHSLLLKNLTKNPKDKQFDLNEDGVVDQKDVQLISKEVNL